MRIVVIALLERLLAGNGLSTYVVQPNGRIPLMSIDLPVITSSGMREVTVDTILFLTYTAASRATSQYPSGAGRIGVEGGRCRCALLLNCSRLERTASLSVRMVRSAMPFWLGLRGADDVMVMPSSSHSLLSDTVSSGALSLR